MVTMTDPPPGDPAAQLNAQRAAASVIQAAKPAAAPAAAPVAPAKPVAKTVAKKPAAKAVAKKPTKGDKDPAPPTGGGGGDVKVPEVATGGEGDGDSRPVKVRASFRTIVLFLCGVLLTMGTAYLILWRTSADGVKVQEKEREVEISKASGAAPPGWTFPRDQVGGMETQAEVPMVTAPKKEIIGGVSFSCGTVEEVLQGFEQSSVTDVTPSQGLSLGPMCFLARFHGGITRVTGSNFYVWVVEKDGLRGVGRTDAYFKCGKFPGLNAEQMACDPVQFIKLYEDVPVRITVGVGGSFFAR